MENVSPSQSPSDSHVGEIIGASVGAFIVMFLVTGAVFYVRKTRNRGPAPLTEPSADLPSSGSGNLSLGGPPQGIIDGNDLRVSPMLFGARGGKFLEKKIAGDEYYFVATNREPALQMVTLIPEKPFPNFIVRPSDGDPNSPSE